MRTDQPSASSVCAHGILGAVGSTPLIRLERYLRERPDVGVWLKLESANPGGGIKDRPALAMLRRAFDEGLIEEGGTVVESSSGNLGVGLAQACRYYGLDFICVVDKRTSPEKVAIMRALGATVEVVHRPDSVGGDLLAARIARVARLCTEIPGAYWPDQYENPANPGVHESETMREIFEQMDGRVDYVVVPVSTCGTLAGCGRFLEAHGCGASLIAVDAQGSVLFGGESRARNLPGLGAGVETGISRTVSPTDLIRVGELECVVGCRRLVDREAVFAGASTGGAVAALSALAPSLTAAARIAVLAPDGGAGYLQTVYDDDWVETKLGVGPRELEALLDAPQPQLGVHAA